MYTTITSQFSITTTKYLKSTSKRNFLFNSLFLVEANSKLSRQVMIKTKIKSQKSVVIPGRFE